ncbi:MAG TPA: DUF2064 domain-containing protein, partial [Chloroflexota bacterium]|nr:DUF2064 domain-containing protein [Chloroflexota bacterium]
VATVEGGAEHDRVARELVEGGPEVVRRERWTVAVEQDDLLIALLEVVAQTIVEPTHQVTPLVGDNGDVRRDEGLEDDAVVLGPTLDGGYYLIGACRPRPALFEWDHLDSATVCRQTQQLAEELGARVALLPPWYDVDTAEDLERLVEELRNYPSRAPRTCRFLERDGRR